MSAWKSLLDKIGVLGSFIAAACCLGPLVVPQSSRNESKTLRNLKGG